MCVILSSLGNEVPIINIVARNSRLPTIEGYINLIIIDKCVNILCMHRERVESLILSSQISTDPQKRVFLGDETVTLTFNLGKVLLNVHVFNCYNDCFA